MQPSRLRNRILFAMSIRLIARELYKLRQEVEALKEALESAPYNQRVKLDIQLQKARGEMQQMRKILDGRIDRRCQ